MDLNDLGWLQYERKAKPHLTTETVGRIGVEHKTNFVLHTTHGDITGIIQGKFRHTATSATEYPKVGDWVIYEKLPTEDKAIIKAVLPRYSVIARKAAGDPEATQIITTNVDTLFIVFGLDQDFNAPLLERYLSMAFEGNVQPIVILNKLDAAKFSQQVVQEVQTIAPEAQVYTISAKTTIGLHQVEALIEPGKTITFVGPSGAGKSTLVNALLGSEIQTTGAVRLSDAKGKHTTTRREMFILPSGGILIDTPGIRELETLSGEHAMDALYEDITALAAACRFRDCDHSNSRDCAILAAVENGSLAPERYDAYMKQLAESAFHDSKTNGDMRWKRKQRDKQIHKGLKQLYEVRKTTRKRPT